MSTLEIALMLKGYFGSIWSVYCNFKPQYLARLCVESEFNLWHLRKGCSLLPIDHNRFSYASVCVCMCVFVCHTRVNKSKGACAFQCGWDCQKVTNPFISVTVFMILRLRSLNVAPDKAVYTAKNELCTATCLTPPGHVVMSALQSFYGSFFIHKKTLNGKRRGQTHTQHTLAVIWLFGILQSKQQHIAWHHFKDHKIRPTL